MITIAFSGALELGLIYGLVALGVYLTFRVINFPDLTVDGSFPLGAAVVAGLLIHGIHPIIATLVAVLAGALAGVVTGYLHVRLRVMGLLAGILTMTALYSVNIRIMGRPNIALLNVDTLFSGNFSPLIILSGIVIFILLIIGRFLLSEYGLALRASGSNPRLSRAYGINVNTTIIITLAISNALVSLAGALFAELQGFADVSLGAGTLITGLASVIIGEAILFTRNIMGRVFACLLGAIVFRIAIAFALNSGSLGLQASDLNLLTALLIIMTLMIPRFRNLIVR
ncbi:MAG: ABC transporter permease [Gammaproteobacteria bacterium]